MKEDTCLYAGGASRRGRAAHSRSHRLYVRVLTCAGTLLALYGAAPVHALSGFPDTGDIGFFSDPENPTRAKFYCDYHFADVSPPIRACAQHTAKQVAVQVNSNVFQLGLESNVKVQFTTSGLITTLTNVVDDPPSAPRNAFVCETAGDNSGLNHCLRITEGAGDTPDACPPKFPSITSDANECAADLLKLERVFGPAHIDFTTERNPNGTLNVNVCHTPASWACDVGVEKQEKSKEIQHIGTEQVHTPDTCRVDSRTYNC